jgi:Glycosyl transferase family 2
MNAPPDEGQRRPLVSVFIQTYQHAPYVADAIDGVLAQEAPFGLELVIADDGSTDGTRELLQGYRDRHPERIRLLLPERNLGPTELFRQSIAELRGDFVAWLDGDDYWTDERKLVRQVEALQEHPEWAACFHNATIVQEDGKAPPRPYVLELGGESVGFARLMHSNIVPSLSLMARGELVRGLPAWTWDSLWSDWSAVLAIALHGDIGYLPEPMGVYRMHGGGVSSGLSRARQLEEDLRFFANLRAVAGEAHGPTIEKILRERHCQLVVERLEVPYAGAIAVLGPRGEAPVALNGRQVWPLAIEEEELATIDGRDRDGRLAAGLERFRLAAPGARPGLAHFADGDRVPEPQGEPALRLLVVGPMLDWLDRHSRLGRQLEGHCRTLWEDETCSLREVSYAADAPLPLGARAEFAEAAMAPGAESVFGCHLDLPAIGVAADAHRVEVAGWVVGQSAPAVAVEVAHGEAMLGRAPVELPRPDLEAAFPERSDVGSAGFGVAVSLVDRDPAVPLDVTVVLADGSRAPLGRLVWERRWRSLSDPAQAPPVKMLLPPAEGDELEDLLAAVRAQTYAKVEVVADAAAGPDDLVISLSAGDPLPPRTVERAVEARAGGSRP